MLQHFDTSLSVLADSIRASLGKEVLESGVVLRDASGQLAFFANRSLDPTSMSALSEVLRDALGPFARQDRLVSDLESPGNENILNAPGIRVIPVSDGSGTIFIRLLDRQIIGMDWLQSPPTEISTPPRFVFASLKGGVGRSTALSVIAADQARKGRNVLVIDLDLEAPGIGSMLLDGDRQPKLGALDFLVESGLGEIQDEAMGDFVGTSTLTAGAGLVNVIPVVGSMTLDLPLHFLPKLARAMVEDISSEGDVRPLNEKINMMVSRFTNRQAYDLVLIDVRAGMAELAAGPLLCLGAKVLLFGTAQNQTIEGYRFLFSHLSTLWTRTAGPSPWRNFQMIHAKASLSDDIHQKFKDDLWDLFTNYLYDELEPDALEGFNFDVDDPVAPHNPIPVLHDSNLVDWDPIKEPTALTRSSHQSTFGPLIAMIEDTISLSSS